MNMSTRYTVHMMNAAGNTDTVEVEVAAPNEADALAQAEFQVRTQPMRAHVDPSWRAVRADRAPGAWMWAA
jgi:hypothetical protein